MFLYPDHLPPSLMFLSPQNFIDDGEDEERLKLKSMKCITLFDCCCCCSSSGDLQPSRRSKKEKKFVQKGKLLAPLSFSFSPHFSTLPVCAHIGAPLSAMMVVVVAVVKNGREKSAGRRFGSIGVRCCCDCGDHYSFTSSFSRTLQQKTTTTLDKVFCCRRCFFLQTNVQMSTFVFVCGGGESGDQTR